MKFIDHVDVERFAKLFFLLVAGVPAACLVISLFYDWGMFRAAGISFSSAPTSITDHFRTTLVWMPRTVEAMAIFGMLATFAASRYSESAGSKKTPSPPLPLSKRKGDLILVGLTILSILFMDFGWIYLGSDRFPVGAQYLLITVWFFYFIWLLKNRKLNESYGRKFLIALAAVTFIVISYHSIAYAAVKQHLEEPCASHRLEIRSGDRLTIMDVRIVRSYADWKLVVPKPKPEPNPFVWIRSDIVQNIFGLNAVGFRGIDDLFEKEDCSSESPSG